MPRFFIAASQITDGRCTIGPPDARHLTRSLRTRPGEVISVADDGGIEHTVRVDIVEPDLVAGVVLSSRPVRAEPGLRVHVVQSLPHQGMDEAVDAMTQAGVAVIWPVLSDRTVPRPDAGRAAKRLERWRAVAREAAGLAYRGRPPDVAELATLATTLRDLPAGTRILACSIGPGTVPLTGLSLDAGRPVALCIGPEGGWSSADMTTLKGGAAERVHLGPRVFRARLAGAIACAVLLAHEAGWESPAPAAGDRLE